MPERYAISGVASGAPSGDLSGKQDADPDLTALAGLGDGYPRRSGGTWSARTATQFRGDIGVGFVSVTDYGAVDGALSTAAIQSALDAAVAGNGALRFPAGTWRFGTLTNNSTRPLRIVGDGAVLACEGRLDLGTPSAGTLTLGANITRGSQTLTVTSTTGVAVGDLISVVTSVIAETDRSRFRRQTFTVNAVPNSTTITTAEPANFDITTSDAGLTVTRYATPRSVVIDGVTFEIRSATNTVRALTLSGVSGARLSNLTFVVDNTAIDVNTGPDGVLLDYCVNTTISQVRLIRCRYGIVPQQANRTLIEDITAERCRHAVVPSFFADDVRVNGLVGVGNIAALDSHEAFEVHYSRATVRGDSEISNIRSCGGSLTDSSVRSDATSGSTMMQNIGFVAGDAALYGLHDFTVRNVEWHAPDGFAVNKGRYVTIDNLRLTNGKSLALSGGGANQITQATVTNTAYDNSTSGNIRCPINTVAVGRDNAVLTSGTYYIRPTVGITGSRGAGMAHQRGLVFVDAAAATDPRVARIRIYTDPAPFDNTGATPFVHGVIRLTGGLRHSNSGGFDIAAAEWHFRHKKSVTTAYDFPTTAAWTAGATGQTNESLTLAISNIAQSAATGSDGRNDYIEFDVTMNSGRTSPVYTLIYELTLFTA